MDVPVSQEPVYAYPQKDQRPILINAGDHLDLEHLDTRDDSLLPYRLIKNLGYGGSASVEKVEDVNTGKLYARKIFKHVNARTMKEAKRQLKNEVQIMKRLSAHHHIVKVHATYIVKRELAIIINPVADGGDLARFLQDYEDSLKEDSAHGWDEEYDNILRRCFGCLASGLAFMHKQDIRHKDIKPQNVLIHRGMVKYTDFGISFDYSEADRSTTTGPVLGLTRRYCAPEVATGASRNSKSDVFSLGCIYLEIINVLYGCVHEDVLDGPFHQTLEKVAKKGTSIWSMENIFCKSWPIEALLNLEHSKRPSASEIATLWAELDNDPETEVLFLCGKCSFDWHFEQGFEVNLDYTV